MGFGLPRDFFWQSRLHAPEPFKLLSLYLENGFKLMDLRVVNFGEAAQGVVQGLELFSCRVTVGILIRPIQALDGTSYPIWIDCCRPSYWLALSVPK
jgi:hypothetical protein